MDPIVSTASPTSSIKTSFQLPLTFRSTTSISQTLKPNTSCIAKHRQVRFATLRNMSRENEHTSVEQNGRFDAYREQLDIWKTVMMTGLTHTQVNTVDELFKKCNVIQEKCMKVMVTEETTEQLEEQCKKTLNEITQMRHKQDGENMEFFLDKAQKLIQIIMETIHDLQKEAKRQILANLEDEYMNNLNNFMLVPVPASGDCMFAAVGKGHILLKTAYAECLGVQGMNENSHNSTECFPDLQHLNYGMNGAALHELAQSYRQKAVAVLRARTEMHENIMDRVREAISKAEAGDATQRKIYSILIAEASDSIEHLGEGLSLSRAVDVYCSVMGTPGFFGTDLELEALCYAWNVSICIWHRSHSVGTLSHAAAPNQIFGEQFSNNGIGPIHLAFYLGKTHYDLLWRRPVVPSNDSSTPFPPCSNQHKRTFSKPVIRFPEQPPHRTSTDDDAEVLAAVMRSLQQLPPSADDCDDIAAGRTLELIRNPLSTE